MNTAINVLCEKCSARATMFVSDLSGHHAFCQEHAPPMRFVGWHDDLAEATKLAAEIHKVLKRGRPSHGLIGDLQCILDHVCRDGDPAP